MKQKMQVSSPFHLYTVVNYQISQKNHCYIASKTKKKLLEECNMNFMKSCKEFHMLLTCVLQSINIHKVIREKMNTDN